MEFETVKMHVKDKIATITLNRPDKKNCMSPQLHSDMLEITKGLRDNKDASVVILTGEGESFCGGMDLEKYFFEPWQDPDEMYRSGNVSFEWFMNFKALPQITIGSVNGWCFGGAFITLGVCDLAIASEKAAFGLSEINFGIFPSGGAMWGAVNFMLPRHAIYYVLTGKTFDGKEAERIGLVNKTVPHEKLQEETMSLAKSILKRHPIALRSAKEVFRKVRGMDLPESIEWEAAKFYEMSYFSKDEWVKEAIGHQFRSREYKPGLESYKRDK